MRTRSSMRRLRTAALLLAVGLTLPACITRTVRDTIYDSDGIRILLRGERRGSSDVDRGYDHPAAIAAERLQHILGAVDIETRKERRVQRPVFYAEQLEPIALALSKAFASANSSQEIVVTAVRKRRRLGLFHRKHLTSFVTYMQDRYLYLHLARVDHKLDKQEEDKIREPVVGKRVMNFRAVPSEGMHAAGPQTIAVRWRDSLFDRPRRTLSSTPSKVKERTILLDTPVPSEERGSQLPPELSDRLDPATLRELADLEEARRAGEITEGEYTQRREQLLRGDAR